MSDYGVPNFMQPNMSVCPGAAIYSAHEAFTENQTAKVCRLLSLTCICYFFNL